MARNLDWHRPKSLGAYSALVRFWKGNRYLYESVGFPGFVGVLSAQREGAWAVTLNQSPCVQSRVDLSQMPACMHLRAACDRASSYGSLVRQIGPWRAMSPYFTHVVGTRRDQQCLMQNIGGHYFHHEPFAWGLAQTNHYLDRADGARVNLLAGWRKGERCDRYNLLVGRLRRRRAKTLEDGFGVLRGWPITHGGTIQQMVMRPATGSLRLRVRR